jgi:hypothetical protein
MKPVSSSFRSMRSFLLFIIRFTTSSLRRKYSRLSFLVAVFTVISFNLTGQQAISFFEPGISITYDTATVRVYKRDARIFRIKSEQIEIRVSAEPPVNDPTRIRKIPVSVSELKSYVQDQVKKLNQQPGSFSFTGLDVIDYDKKMQKAGDFLCYGFVELDKKTNRTSTTIFAFHISENAYTRIDVKSFENKSLPQHYKQLETFLAGFKAYTKAELLKHDLLNAKKYTIVVNKTNEVLPRFKNRPGAYLAVVSTKEKLEDRVKEVIISDDGSTAELYSPNEKGEVYIARDVKKKGLFNAKGEFIFYSSIGKQVRIPFSFQYEIK